MLRNIQYYALQRDVIFIDLSKSISYNVRNVIDEFTAFCEEFLLKEGESQDSGGE